MGVYSNLAASVIKENATASASPAQFLAENENTSFNLFNAIIECDFASAYNKAGMISLTEAQEEKIESTAKKNLGEKIVEAIKKFVLWIKGYFKKAVDRIMVLAGKDKGLYDKYKDVITADKVKGTTLKGEVPVVNAIDQLKTSFITSAEKVTASTADSISKMIFKNNTAEAKSLMNADTVDEYVKNAKEAEKEHMKNLTSETGTLSLAKYIAKDKSYADVDLAEMTMVIKEGYKKAITSITLAKDSIVKDMEQTQLNISKALNTGDADSEDTKILNGAYEVTSISISTLTKECNVAVSIAYSVIAAYRRIWFQLGKSLKSDSKSDKETVSAEAYSIGLSSDYCVENCLGELA